MAKIELGVAVRAATDIFDLRVGHPQCLQLRAQCAPQINVRLLPFGLSDDRPWSQIFELQCDFFADFKAANLDARSDGSDDICGRPRFARELGDDVACDPSEHATPARVGGGIDLRRVFKKSTGTQSAVRIPSAPTPRDTSPSACVSRAAAGDRFSSTLTTSVPWTWWIENSGFGVGSHAKKAPRFAVLFLDHPPSNARKLSDACAPSLTPPDRVENP